MTIVSLGVALHLNWQLSWCTGCCRFENLRCCQCDDKIGIMTTLGIDCISPLFHAHVFWWYNIVWKSVSLNWGLCCQKQISQAWISNYIPQNTVGCNNLSMPEKPASGNKVLNSSRNVCQWLRSVVTSNVQGWITHQWKWMVFFFGFCCVSLLCLGCMTDILTRFKPLWPFEDIWRQKSGSSLAEVMACCLTTHGHYLNHFWLVTQQVPMNLIRKHFGYYTFKTFKRLKTISGANKLTYNIQTKVLFRFETLSFFSRTIGDQSEWLHHGVTDLIYCQKKGLIVRYGTMWPLDRHWQQRGCETDKLQRHHDVR